MENVSLKKVTLAVYGIPDDREYALTGLDWLTSEHFDIEAKFPGRYSTGSDAADAAGAARGAVQARAASGDEAIADVCPDGREERTEDPAGGGWVGEDIGQAGSLLRRRRPDGRHFADLIGRFMGQQVGDETGLKGVFDFTLEWSPDEMKPGADVGGVSLFHCTPGATGAKAGGEEGSRGGSSGRPYGEGSN